MQKAKIKQESVKNVSGKTKFNKLRPLVLMQLKDKIDFSFTKSKKKTIFKVISSLALFISLTAIIYLMFSLIVSFGVFSFLKTLNFRAYLVLMTLIFALSFLSCLLKVTNTLYFSKDNPVLITMPVSQSSIFSSKLIVCFIYELIKNFSYILPFFFAYGLIMGLPIVFYLWAIISVVIFTLLSVSLSGILSIPTMWVLIAFKRLRILEFIVVGGVVVAFVIALIKGIAAIPEDIDLIRDWGKIYWSIQNFLASFTAAVAGVELMLNLFTGMVYNGFSFKAFTSQNVLTLLVILGIVIVCLALIYLLSKPLFLKMISSPFEFKKNEKLRKDKNVKLPKFLSSVLLQAKITLRSPNLLYQLLAVAVIAPIAVFLENKIIAAMDTKLLGDFMGIAFNILIIMLLTLSSNVTAASIYSREGNSSYLNKIHPVPFIVPLFGKLVFAGALNIISIIVSVAIINQFNALGAINTISLTLTLIMIYVAHLLWSAELDVMNPQTREYQTTGGSQKNPNELKSTVIAFLVSALVAFITFFLMSEDVRKVYLKLIIIAAIFFAIRVVLYCQRVRLYYKEKG